MMESGLEAAGALATAAAAANAIDPDEPRRDGHGQACLNCGAAVSGAYCSNCGQKAHLHRSVLHAVEEFLHGITHFDSKLWNTLPLLFVRPGKLTRDYVHGKRARYVAPVALFLLTVLAMYVVFSFASAPSVPQGAVAMPAADAKRAVGEIDVGLKQIEADLAAARADPARADEVRGLEMALVVARQARARAERLAETGGYVSEEGSLTELVGGLAREGLLKVEVGNVERNQKAQQALQNPEFVFYKMQQKGYKLSFLLVPLSLPWMIMLFAWKKDVKVYDHIVFLLYSISFMSILFILGATLSTFGLTSPQVYSWLLLIPLVHIFAQLKEGYALGWGSAAWRTVLLSIFAVLTLTLYFTGILLLGLLD